MTMWYSANLFFKGTRDESDSVEPLWEERIILVGANNETEAEEKARQLGTQELTRYETSSGTRITWAFDRVDRCCLIEAETLGEGTELFWRFLRDSEVASLLTPFDDSV
jgi:hypothetical protein